MRISDWSSDVCSSDLIEAHGLKEGEFTLTTEGLRALIQFYTREAGVRTLEREIAKLARKALRKILEGKAESVTITPDNLGEFAGVRKYRYGLSEEENQIGAVTGQIGRAHVSTPVTNEPLVCRLLLDK